MKKQIKQILFLILVVIVLCTIGCTFKDKPLYTYSNLIDEKSQDNLTTILRKVNIQSSHIEEFLEELKLYNKTPYPQSLTTGYHKSSLNELIYDYTKAIDTYTRKDKVYINCRTASFILFRQNIHCDTEKLSMQNSSIANELDVSLVSMSDEERLKYAAIFTNYSVVDNDSNTWLKFVLRKRGISFEENLDVKLVTVHAQFKDNNSMQIAHVGILIHQDDKIVFIEKINPIMPFQLSVFENIENLSEYLINRFKETTSRIFVYENDMLISKH